MAIQIVRATKKNLFLRMALTGPSGSGKTYTALTFAFALAGQTGKVLTIDTEHRSAAKYADQFPPFDVIELDSYSPNAYLEGLKLAESNGYTVLVIDSLSHAWEAEGGVLDIHDQAAKRTGNSFTAWKEITPIQNRFMEALLASNLHLIVTMRSKMAYVQTEDERTHKQVVKKMGMEPIQRQGSEYLFDLVADMDIEHNLVVSKTRCSAVADQVVNKPAGAWLAPVMAWLDSGVAVPPPAPRPAAPAAQAKPAQQTPTLRFAPDALKIALQKSASIHDRMNQTASDDQRATVAVALEMCFAGDPRSAEMRNQVALWLSDAKSLSEISGVMLLAMLDWLKPVADSGGALKPDARAVQEALAVWDQIAKTPAAGDELAEFFGGESAQAGGK
jgi:energy-coupling factor transporter ATP-binding protein EcfA2